MNYFANQINQPPRWEQGYAEPLPPPPQPGIMNTFGSKMMQVMEDPRNAWIGMGPLAGMARIPKAAGAAKKFVEDLSKNYDFPWNGKLYRAGEVGKSPTGANYYAIDPEMASNYGKDVKEYEFPDVRKVYHVDTDNLAPLRRITGKKFDPNEDDIAIHLEEAIPHLKAKGYEGMVIEGDTGSQLSGTPLEFVHFGNIKMSAAETEQAALDALGKAKGAGSTSSYNRWRRKAEELSQKADILKREEENKLIMDGKMPPRTPLAEGEQGGLTQEEINFLRRGPFDEEGIK